MRIHVRICRSVVARGPRPTEGRADAPSAAPATAKASESLRPNVLRRGGRPGPASVRAGVVQALALVSKEVCARREGSAGHERGREYERTENHFGEPLEGENAGQRSARARGWSQARSALVGRAAGGRSTAVTPLAQGVTAQGSTLSATRRESGRSRTVRSGSPSRGPSDRDGRGARSCVGRDLSEKSDSRRRVHSRSLGPVDGRVTGARRAWRRRAPSREECQVRCPATLRHRAPG